MSWPSVSVWPCGSMNWSWPVEPTRRRTCSGSSTPGTSTTIRCDPSPPVSVRTCGSLTPMPATRRSMMARAVSMSAGWIGSLLSGSASSVTRMPPSRSSPSTVLNSTPATWDGSQSRPRVLRGRSMKIATRATTPITHGAMRRQVMLGRRSSIFVGMSCGRLSASDTKRAASPAAGGQSIADKRPFIARPARGFSCAAAPHAQGVIAQRLRVPDGRGDNRPVMD